MVFSISCIFSVSDVSFLRAEVPDKFYRRFALVSGDSLTFLIITGNVGSFFFFSLSYSFKALFSSAS
jgi:hypothetical protein